jgi:hypothetical protein
MTYTPQSLVSLIKKQLNLMKFCFTCHLTNITTMIVTGFVTITVRVNSKPTSSLHVFKSQAHFFDIILQLMDLHPTKATCEVWLTNCVHHKIGIWRFQLEYYLHIGLQRCNQVVILSDTIRSENSS